MESASNASAWDNSVDERIKLLRDTLAENEQVRTELPGLESLLRDYLAEDVDVQKQDFHRRLLQVFRDSAADNTYQDLLAEFSAEEQKKISKFVAGEDVNQVCHGFDMSASLGVREHVKAMLKADAVHISSEGPVHVKGLSMGSLQEKDGLFHRFVQAIADLFTSGTSKEDTILVYKDARFQNWGQIVDYVPTYTCIPSSVAGIQRIVKYAKEFNMGVRCAGFRHSWAPIFGRNGQILISLLGLAEVTKIPNLTALLPEAPPNKLETIEVVSEKPRVEGNSLVRVGVSTTNERLRRWCLSKKKYTLPLNVIMVEMTIGGTNGPICHGAGRAHQTLSDLVRRIEYVDCNGELRVVDKPEHLRAAAGCFGLMGVITHITLEFSPMTYALTQPQKIPVVRAVPPPADIEIPPALRVPGLTAQEKAEDLARFEKQCTSDYYCEWFWFPYSDYSWVNCWNDTTDSSGVEDYPTEAMVFFQFVSQFTMNVIQNATVLQDLITATHLDEAAVTLLSRAAMFAMPDKPVKTYLTDALHFQRGIQNVRVLDLEVEMPILAKKDAPGGTTSPDFGLVRRAWWDAILKCYKYSKTSPQRMPLEMRIMGGSDIVMAPQRGNGLGTCAIEVLTLREAGATWNQYAQEVLDVWMSYKDGEGRKLRTRPHWAKQWADFKVDRKDWSHKMKQEDYKEEIVEFKGLLAEIGRDHGWTLADLKKRFSNEFFDVFYFDDVTA